MNYAMVYDTAWTMALGLNNSLNYLNDSGLQQYSNNPYYLNGILKGIQDVNFAGVSVSVFMLQLTSNFYPPFIFLDEPFMSYLFEMYLSIKDLEKADFIFSPQNLYPFTQKSVCATNFGPLEKLMLFFLYNFHREQRLLSFF